MTSTAGERSAMAEIGRMARHWLHGWWRIVHLGSTLIVLALSPASYDAAQRAALAGHAYLGTAPALAWFSVLSALLSVVVIRIVLVTSLSYGLSQYALEMVVRVLVLELIPLTAALFAALRCTLPQATDVAALRAAGGWARLLHEGQDPVRREVMPRVMAGVFAVWTLAAVSCGLTLVLAYLSVYGFNTTGFAAYTRTVGHVFEPAVALIFVLKIVFFSLAVSLIPVASVLYDRPHPRLGTSTELQGLVRMFLLLLLIEAVSLVGNYY
jgi:phospholipid/cholesterol/gamma-HCH transport system permease protein